MKVFIDTNIFIDFIAARQPFAKEAAIIFQLADNKEIDLLLSDLTIINTIYILQRLHYPIDEIIENRIGNRRYKEDHNHTRIAEDSAYLMVKNPPGLFDFLPFFI